MYGLPDDYFRYFGYYTDSAQPIEQPTCNPSLEVGCPLCQDPLTPETCRTISFMAWGGVTSFFYRVHQACHDRVGDAGLTKFEERLLAAIPPDDQNPGVLYLLERRHRAARGEEGAISE
jgi:hypothetical protein